MKKVVLSIFVLITNFFDVSAQSFTLSNSGSWGTTLQQDDHPYNGDRDSILYYNPSTFSQPPDKSFVFLNHITLKNTNSRNTIQDVFYQWGKGRTWCLITQQTGASGMGSVYTVIIDAVRKDKNMVEFTIVNEKNKKTKRLLKLPF